MSATPWRWIRGVGFILGAALILSMYLIVPLLLALQSHVPVLGVRLLIAVGLLLAVEVPVVVVLNRTTRFRGLEVSREPDGPGQRHDGLDHP